ncbi:ATP-binding protein [Marivirga atlantica]|jgi:signal transduction histidine kinase|uniref:histidine kinase n=1 Tax=Marivirga atlantica TaxID=1548457 RepID=A0A937AIQ9_9BACT|nr:transporter substrate-binding domain-containing protein [Marivirga atlantica]MBL0764338.1 transporter substrate-binding domain-containing protein [Marivirga atlantica]
MRSVFVLYFMLMMGMQTLSSAEPVIATDHEMFNSEDTVELNLFWFVSKPFIYKNEKGELTGIEYDILNEYKSYLANKYGVNLRLNWIEADSFGNIIDRIQAASNDNHVGVSAFSITPERLEKVDFSHPYLADFTVLVSSEGTPILKTLDEVNKTLSQMEAVTISGTTYEEFLFELKNQLQVDFNIHYINSDKNVLNEVSKADNRFGFIDLPIYLMLIKNGGNLTRQNFFTKRGNGYAFMFPKASKWKVRMDSFLMDPQSREMLAEITSNYIGEELFEFIENIYGGHNLGTSLLTKEKELQNEQLILKEQLLEKEKQQRIYLMIALVAMVILIGIIAFQYYRQQKIAETLLTQNKKVESQQRNIESKNEQLFNRNLQLTSLNEEKNSLVKILAHDLRSPINQIQGLVEVLSLGESTLDKESTETINQIKDAAKRVNNMISKILDFDALEEDRMKVIKEEINVENLVAELANNFKNQAENKKIELIYQVPVNTIIYSDHLYFTQILENLISNAIKFSEKETRVWVEVFDDQQAVVVKVVDEGPGLTEQDKRLIFNKYQKLSAKPTNGESSTGLGLSIVKKYAELLDITLTYQSEVDKGTTFILKIPKYKKEG